jgi:predicted nucleic acid-binding protein
MPEAVVDTGPLIHLDEINQLILLLAVFSTIHIPEAVVGELTNQKAKAFISQYTEKIKTITISDQALFSAKDAHAGFRLQLADLAVLAIIQQIANAVAVTDDLELRKAIEQSGRTVTGTVGILFRANQLQLISTDQLRDAVNRLFDDSSLYLSSSFKTRIISMIGSL